MCLYCTYESVLNVYLRRCIVITRKYLSVKAEIEQMRTEQDQLRKRRDVRIYDIMMM